MLENDVSPSTKPKTTYLADYRATDFLIPKVSLDVSLTEDRALIRAQLTVRRNGDHTEPLCLDGEKMQLLSLALDGKPLSEQDYVLDETSLSIATTANEFVLSIDTQSEPHLNTELSGLYQSSGNFCTQCEAEGFRRITYFLDRPDVLSVYDVRITADHARYPVLLSNGNKISHGSNDDGTHWALWQDPHPKPCYLFALVAGDLQNISDEFVTMSGQSVQLNIYTQAHNIDKCAHAMKALKKSMLWDEQVYGREYDLEIYNVVAVDDFNMGAMENKGLNIFNSKYVLANQQTATDADFEGIESVIGHEYFHNWSGNRVTCRDWFQLSLKEGFTVFRDQEFSADQGSRAVKRIRDVQVLRAHQFKEDAGPMAHPVRPDSYQEINNFYTVTIYEKGAEVIRMMHSLVGAAGFRAATDLYFSRFDGQAVTTEDFVRCMEEANNIDLTQFRLWYTQAGTPQVNVRQEYSNGTLSLSFSQSCPATPGQSYKAPFHIPINLALFTREGKEVTTKTIELRKQREQISFENLSSQPVVSLLRGFSAPIKLEFEQSNAELMLLIKAEDNGFARWDAMQRLCLNVLLPAIRAGKVDPDQIVPLQETFKGLLSKPASDLAILAELLTLPANNYVAELCSPIEPQTITMVRRRIIRLLADALHQEFAAIYHANVSSDFALTSTAMAQRAIKNRALMYLIATERPEYYELAKQQYLAANNMTDRLAAFMAILQAEHDNQELVADFYQQWSEHSLVLDKWFASQASVERDDALARVKSLLAHPDFSLKNPNKVRALLGAFASNIQGFHQDDGLGYQFLADQIIRLNDINPQIAARLVGVFNSWRKYAEPYASLMSSQLERIASQENLSKDVSEIVGKALT